MNELKTLKSPTFKFHGQYNKDILTSVLPLAYSADLPERASLNNVLNFAGNASRRWGHTTLVSPSVVKACKKCFVARIQRYLRMDVELLDCEVCCNWDFFTFRDCNYFHPPLDYPTQKHYQSPPAPTGRDVGNATMLLHPQKLTFDHLKQAYYFAAFNFVSKDWNTTQLRAYARVVGLNKEFVNTQIIDKLKDGRRDKMNPRSSTFVEWCIEV